MPEEDVPKLEDRITRSTGTGIRGRLVSQGLARSMIWTGGSLPEGSPNFSPLLTADLLAYGFSLLSQAMRLREAGGREALQRRAFELAAESIESVVRSGDPESAERGFHRVIAASAYHLAHFSARSYSLIPSRFDELNLSPAETALALLLRRRLDDLGERTFTWLTDDKHSDEAMAELLSRELSSSTEDEILQLALNTTFHRGLALFHHAIQTGDASAMPRVRVLFKEGEVTAQEFGEVALWWIFILTRHLTDDLWNQSFHQCLPTGPAEDSSSTATEWRRLRRSYIALLACRNLAEIDLWPSQLEAARRALDVSDNIVASLPTSAGKTRIAELCILRALSMDKRVVFVTPLRALSAQTERTLRHTFANLGFSVTSLYGASGAGPLDRDTLRNRQIVVATPEKLDFALRNDPSLLDDVGLVVLDEAHTLGMGEREVRYEILVQALLRRSDSRTRRIVCLSALLPDGPDLNDFVAWIRQDEPGEPVNCEWRPTRRRFGEVIWQKTKARYQATVAREETFIPTFFVQTPPKGKRRTPFPRDRNELTLATAWRLAEDFKSVLIYCPLRKSVEKLARELLQLLQEEYLPSLWLGDTSSLDEATKIGAEWLGTDHPAIGCLRYGVAVHHGQLPRPFQRSVESLLRQNHLRVTIASPTLAQGLNLSAHTLLFHSLYRGSDPIPSSEFANVAGRAGRAFVDLEGQVLCGFYGDEKPSFVSSWKKLISEAKETKLQSGLTLLVLELAKRIVPRSGGGTVSTFVEYLMGNAKAWQVPPEPNGNTSSDRKEKEFLKKWDTHVASLDCALLSLLSNNEEIPEQSLAETLDRLLASSLWERTLKRMGSNLRAIATALLLGRAGYIYRNSTPKQRKGYFFAGIGLITGAQLDLHAETLNNSLRAADAAIWNGQVEIAINAMKDFARIAFEIFPFKVKELPAAWEILLMGWIQGESVTTIKAKDETGEFIESGLVYRLVWAMEAVRVRAVAHEEWIEQHTDGAAATAVESGTPTIPCAVLIQNGLSSRIAAIRSIHLCKNGFSTVGGMRDWLKSTEVRNATSSDQWPTPETSSLWRRFVGEQDSVVTRAWQDRSQVVRVNWNAGSEVILPGTPVRLFKEADGTCGIYTLEMNRLGSASGSASIFARGIIQARADVYPNGVHITRFGP